MFISILYMFRAVMWPSSGELLYQYDTHEKLCVKLVIYKDHTRMHGQQNTKKLLLIIRPNVGSKLHDLGDFSHLF